VQQIPVAKWYGIGLEPGEKEHFKKNSAEAVPYPEMFFKRNFPSKVVFSVLLVML